MTAEHKHAEKETVYAGNTIDRGKPIDPNDDLRWLVGQWRCVGRQYFRREEYLIARTGANVLECLNVYFPFADEQFLEKHEGERNAIEIAAELLVCPHASNEFGPKPLRPMFEPGPVAISKGVMSYGHPLSEDFKFKCTVNKYGDDLWLTLESKSMKFELVKESDRAGDISDSFVTAPLRRYKESKRSELLRQYEILFKGADR